LDFMSADEGVEDKVTAPVTSYQQRKSEILPRYASCTGLAKNNNPILKESGLNFF